MGFNIGSTKIRQSWKGKVKKFFFESPLVRLMKEYGYRDVYESGQVLPQGFKARPNSIIIYRYYDSVSKEIANGERGEIEEYALGLANVILDLYKHFESRLNGDPTLFKVYLVTHSMGGLICRCFLQNEHLFKGAGNNELVQTRKMVDKVFTYATPHNGIDLKLIGNLL